MRVYKFCVFFFFFFVVVVVVVVVVVGEITQIPLKNYVNF